MLEVFSLINGTMVKCNNKIMMVADPTPIQFTNKVGLVDEATFKKSSGFSDDFANVEYYNVNEVESIEAVKANPETIKSFFRLEADIWKLTKENKYPFAPKCKPFVFSVEDLEVFVKKLKKTRKDILFPWLGYFVITSLAKPKKITEESFFSIEILWALIKSELELFGRESFESESLKVLKDMIQAYKSNQDKNLNEFKVSDFIKGYLIEIIEKKSQNEKLNKKEREAYIKFINEFETKHLYTLSKIADAYYLGNNIVEADWKKAEKALINLFKKVKDPLAASRLANIYCSSVLGEPDYKKAFEYLNKKANSEDIECDYMLSDLLRKGLGTRKNTKKAFDLINRAYENITSCLVFGIEEENFFDGQYPEVALRMGIFYEEELGTKVNYHIAMQYYLKAKYCLEMRSMRQSFHSDDLLMKAINSRIGRVADKNDSNEFDFSDMPGYPGAAYQDLTKRDVTRLQKLIDKIFASNIQTFIFRDSKASFVKTIEDLLDSYNDEQIYQASFDWVKKNADDYDKVSFFIYVFDQYLSELTLANPYPLLAFLFIKIMEKKKESDENNLISLIISLLGKAGFLSYDKMKTYTIDTDKNFVNEVKRQKAEQQ